MSDYSRRTVLKSLLSTAVAATAPRGTVLAQPRETILVFDVNETLLDVSALAPHFVRIFGRGDVLSEWFTNVVLYSQTHTIAGPYAAAFNHYVRDELGYENDLPYEQISRRVQPWSFKDFEGKPIDVSPRLERAMRQNPDLRQ